MFSLPNVKERDPLWEQVVREIVPKLTVSTPKGPAPIVLFEEWEDVILSASPNKLIAAGEGSGKSLWSAVYLVCRMVYDIQFGPQLYWIVGKDFEDARMEFDYFMDLYEQVGTLGARSTSNAQDQPCFVITDLGHEVRTISAYDATKIARREPLGIIGSECSRWEEEILERCEGRLVRNYPHSWGFFSGSPEASVGWFADMYEYAQGQNERGFRSFQIPSWCNLAKYPLGREDPAIKRAEASRSPQKFKERFGAAFAAPEGLVCHTFRNNLHVDSFLEYDPELPVYVGIDPGGIVYAVEFVQFPANGDICILDEIYAYRWTHEEIINEFKARPLGSAVVGGSIDIASKQVQNAMPVSLDEWRKDTGLSLWVKKCAVDDTVDKLLWALAINPNTGRPRLRVRPNCKGIISEMGGGKSPVPKGGNWMRHQTPQGTWGAPKRENDHACKGLAYLLQGPYAHMTSSKPKQVSYLSSPGRARSASYVGASRQR